MKTGKWICPLIIGLMLLITGRSFADDLFQQLLTERIVDYYDLGDADIEVELRSDRIDFDSFNYDDLTIEPLTHSEPRGLLSFQVTFLENNKEVKTGQVRVKIAYFDEVLVSTERLGRHTKIDYTNTQVERMEITSLTARPLTSDDRLTDSWTKRDIRKGQILSSNSVEKIPAIFAGQGVSVLYKSSAIEVSLRGVAMDSGCPGDKIRIKNESSKKILTCTVLDSETVEIASN